MPKRADSLVPKQLIYQISITYQSTTVFLLEYVTTKSYKFRSFLPHKIRFPFRENINFHHNNFYLNRSNVPLPLEYPCHKYSSTVRMFLCRSIIPLPFEYPCHLNIPLLFECPSAYNRSACISVSGKTSPVY